MEKSPVTPVEEQALNVGTAPAADEFPNGFRGRGIPFRILMEQVRNTAPFLFTDEAAFTEKEPHLTGLREWGQKPTTLTNAEMTQAEYFRLCLQCHHATVATFVPTDVDVHIRFKMWQPPITGESRREMAELVIQSLGWDFTRVSTRVVVAPSGELMSGHQGEWFSTAVAAYASCMKWEEELAHRLSDLIMAEIHREARVFEEFKAKKDGLGLHQTATVIAHNLGDLDRVIDQWELPDDDPLKKLAYKAGHEEKGPLPRELWEAGELNKAHMALENHRHFALRRPRCLRRSEKFLLPIAPFLQDWGRYIASTPLLTSAEKGGVAESLVDGCVRLPLIVGYARALAGMEEGMPGGAAALWNEMPARNAKGLQTGKIRQAVTMPRERFEASWNRTALKFLKLI